MNLMKRTYLFKVLSMNAACFQTASQSTLIKNVSLNLTASSCFM